MTLTEAQTRIAALELELQRALLENAIHASDDPEHDLAALAGILHCEFRSDTLFMMILSAAADPSRRHTAPAAPIESLRYRQEQRDTQYYTREHFDYAEYLCDNIFEPQTQVMVFRADKSLGFLLNPSTQYFFPEQLTDGRYMDWLLPKVRELLREMDRCCAFPNNAAISSPHTGQIKLYQMYHEAVHTADYSWNLPGNLHTFEELKSTPIPPSEQMELNRLEKEFSSDIEQLLFFEAAAVQDRILAKLFAHTYPLSLITQTTVSRLRNALAVAEVLIGLNPEQLTEMDRLIYNTATTPSVPELQDRVHDFFASLADFSPRQTQRKSLQILEFIESNYKNPLLSAQTICDRFRISQTYLSRLIKQETGGGLVDAIHRCRIENAKHLLTETSLGIEAIALQVGFSNRFSLVRAFKRIEETTPDAWRREHPQSHPKPEEEHGLPPDHPDQNKHPGRHAHPGDPEHPTAPAHSGDSVHPDDPAHSVY